MKSPSSENYFVFKFGAERNAQRGFSLIEVIVAVGLASILAMGSSYLIMGMYSAQKRTNVLSNVNQMRVDLITALSQNNANNPMGSAWAKTIADLTAATGNPSMACLANNTACIKNATVADINVKYIDGSEAFYGRIPTRGFGLSGQLCNTFSAVPANADPLCPFRWNLTWVARCVGQDKPSCENPLVEISGVLVYEAGPGNLLEGVAINLPSYSFTVRRSDKGNLNLPVVLTYRRGDNTPEPGSCNLPGAGWHPRLINLILTDPGGVAALGPAANEFTLQTGAYDCRVQVPGFKNGGNRIRLAGGGLDFMSAPSNASLFGGATVAALQATFVIPIATTFQVLHRCTNKPTDQVPFGGSGDAFILGVPVPGPGADYSDVTYTTISCLKTS